MASPFYSTGTVSLVYGTNPSRFIGTGTAWQAAGVMQGDVIKLKGTNFWAYINAVNSNTQLDLAEDWPGGGDVSAAEYIIELCSPLRTDPLEVTTRQNKVLRQVEILNYSAKIIQVDAFGLAAPAGGEPDGTLVVVAPAGATGAYAGKESRILRLDGTAWVDEYADILAPGWQVFDKATKTTWVWNGSLWQAPQGGGIRVDAVVANIAGRAAYDGEPKGFVVLVESDSGHSNNAWIYTKASNTSADWTGGYAIRGPSVADGDKGDIVVSGSGAAWTVDTSAITDTKLNDSAIRFAGAEESVATASTVNLTSTKARVLLTGTTAATTITMGNNQRRRVRVQDGWMCNVPGVLVRWLPPGSIVVFESDGSGNVRVVQRALTIGNVSHIEADDPWPAIAYKPAIYSNWASKPWLDDGWYYANASGNRSYYDSKGIIRYAGVNEPAFDTIWGTGERGLQCFGARTNLVLRSNELSNASWVKATNLTGVTADATGFVDGTVTMDKIYALSAGGSSSHWISQLFGAVADNLTVSQSFFLKAGEFNRILCQYRNKAGQYGSTIFNISNPLAPTATNGGTFSTNRSCSIEDCGNGFFRCYVSYDVGTGVTISSFGVEFFLVNNSGLTSFVGNDVDGIYVGGIQSEVASYSSPYIPTAGSQVTRASDVLYRDLPANIVNQNEMTVYVRGAWRNEQVAGMTTQILAALGPATATFGQDCYLSRLSNAYTISSGSDFSSFASVIAKSAKVASRIKTNDVRTYANATAAPLDNTETVPSGINRLTVGNAPWAGTGVQMGGNVMEVDLWSRGLPDAALQAIST